jgi:Fur family transcriptional regulator, peroxide stress response regulator
LKRKVKDGELEAVRRKLGERGAHVTKQRLSVYEYLAEVSHHPTAEEVFRSVKRRLPKISLATVYKNLEALVACGAAAKLTYGDGAARYDVRTDQHHHTRCLACGRVSDMEAAEGDERLRRIRPAGGFRVRDYRLELLGYCKGCAD